MNSSSPRSSPPPGLPRDLVARARIQTESEELSAVADARVQAMLEFELAALHEHGLGDAELATEHYRLALERRSGFRPALFALARLHADADEPLAAAQVWDALARTTRAPAESAEALCEAGLLLHDRLGQRERAAELWEEALALDPSCAGAALLLEQHHRTVPSIKEARRAVELHARGLSDPQLEAALLAELAAADERAGDTDAALARLAEAAELDTSARSVWYETERIARRHGRNERLAAALAALAAREQDDPARSAALLCEAGRVLALHCDDLHAARPLYDRALERVPGDALALWERSLLHAALGERGAAIADARVLLAGASDPALAAATRVRLAEWLAAEGDHAAAVHELHAAVAAAPESATANAAIEETLLRANRFEALRDHLLARAERCAGPARAEHLLRAARVMLLQLDQSGAALDLIDRAAATAERPDRVLRSRYAAAVFAGDQRAAIDAVDRLCRGELDGAERSVLRFDQYHRTRRADGDDAILPLLDGLLGDAALADWAPQAARIHAAGAREYRLLARAHDALAANARDDARASAHLCAAARALARAGEPRAAADRAHAALGKTPENRYALALVEECLLAAGDGREAAAVLRDAARTHAGGKQRELALLHAGAAAESAGDPHAAARAYEDATEVDPGSLAPRWALLRLAERTRDRGLLLAALERLAQREREIGAGGIANLELGELLGSQRLGQAASSPLRAALGRADTRAAAALELCMLPANEIAPALRDEAVAALAECCADQARLALLRDGLAVRLQTDAYGARALLEALVAEHQAEPALAVIAFAAAAGDSDRSQALLRLAHVTTEATAGAELVLHGMRVALLAGGEDAAEDALLRALEAAQSAPGSLAAAVALDEALWAGDDAESRLIALSGRLAQATAETRAPLLAARARALLAAGRAGEAAEAARAALVDGPDDLALWELLRAAARARGDWESAAEAAERLAQAADGRLRSELLEEAAVLLQNELGHNERAERCLRAAFDCDPSAELAFTWLHDLLLERRDLPALLALIEQRSGAIDPEQRLDLDYERALLLRAQGRKDEAIVALDAVLARDPRHTGALGLRVEICTAGEQWRAAVSALQRLAEADVPDAQKRLARLGAADFLERKLDDVVGACAELEALCALTPDDLVQRARLCGLYERCARYRDAVQGYTSAAALSSGAEAAALERRAGAILRDSLGAVGDAVEAFARALAADPLDESACGQLLEISDGEAEREPVLAAFADATHRALDREPLRPELLRKLRRIGQWRGRSDLERVALNALRAIDALDDGERRDLAELERKSVEQPRVRLPTEALLRVAAAVQSATLAPAAQLLSLAFATSADEALPRWDAAALSAELAPEQRFEAGARALAQHLGVLALQRRDRPAQREAFRAALTLLDSAHATAESTALAKQLGKRLSRPQRKELVRALGALQEPDREIEAYLDALAFACTRAGMVAADDPRPALARTLPGGRIELETIAATPRALELLRFWLSRDLLELRRELGWSP